MNSRSACWLAILLLVAAFAFSVGAAVHAAENNAPAVAAAKADEPKGESAIWWFLRSSGVIGLGILCLSIYFVALVIRMFNSLKLELAVPLKVSTDFKWMIGQGNYQGAYDVVRTSDSFLGRVVAKGIEHLPNGLAEARNAMERTGDAETVRMEKQISMMAVLGTLGPMIGLLGTLLGMIESFSQIELRGVNLKAGDVAGGISRALLLTFEGVALAVPAIYFFAFFRNRIATISVDAMLEADDLLHQFFRAGRPRAAASSAAAGQTPPVKTGKTTG